MAGAGFKTFNTGDVLLASEVNTYLMQQTVMVFDDATARTSALGANVAEGMFSYLKDTNLTYRYDGSAWLSDAGTTSPLTTKGDVWGYSTTDARIPVGADGTVLTADSSQTLGVKWAAAGGGKVLQVVSVTLAAARSTSSTSYVDISGVTASITPSSVSSKILVISDFPHSYMNQASGGTTAFGFINQMRDSTQINQTICGWYISGGSGGQAIGDLYTPSNMITMDEPATTSSITYKSQFKQSSGTAFYANGASTFKITMTLMEIGA